MGIDGGADSFCKSSRQPLHESPASETHVRAVAGYPDSYQDLGERPPRWSTNGSGSQGRGASSLGEKRFTLQPPSNLRLRRGHSRQSHPPHLAVAGSGVPSYFHAGLILLPARSWLHYTSSGLIKGGTSGSETVRPNATPCSGPAGWCWCRHVHLWTKDRNGHGSNPSRVQL